VKTKRKRIISDGKLYLFDKLKLTDDITIAKDYGIFAGLNCLLASKKFGTKFHITKTISIDGIFDSRFEMQIGGIRGFINKILLKLIRFLDSQRRDIEK